jgi:acyl-CoA-binding protein
MDLKILFEQAVSDGETLSVKPSNDTLLQLYSLHQQATEGDSNTEFPADSLDYVAKAKHKAWQSLKGTSKKTAMKKYIDLINKLKE